MKLNFSYNFKIFLLIIIMNMRSLLARKAMWFSLFLFALTLLFLFPFAFGIEVLHRFDVQIGCYWMIEEFIAAMLILNMFKLEQEGGVLDIYGGTRSSKFSFFFAKVVFTTFHFLSLQIPLTILWGVIFNINIDSLLFLLPTLLFANIIFAFTSSLLGAFLYAITYKNQVKEILQPLLFFPLQSALLLACVGVCLEVHSSQTMLNYGPWWNVIFIYPILFIGLSLLFGDTLLEE